MTDAFEHPLNRPHQRDRHRDRYNDRYRRIVFFFARILIGIIFWDILLPALGLQRWSQRTRSNRIRNVAVKYRALAIHMGGVLIKVGQFLSARVDVLPSEIINELAGLQDEVPEENFTDIRQLVEGEFNVSLEELFLNFEQHPEAAASLGQVHRAIIKANKESGDTLSNPKDDEGFINVVVKVQRPDIETIITTDLAALRTVGKWVQRYRPISRRINVPVLLNEFSRILYEEIDYLAEGKNAETFATNFTNRPGVRVPKVYWTFTTKRVLTLEDVRGIKINDYAQISASGISRAEVAERLFQTYLVQIFEDGFFHADPHPGNLFISPITSDSVSTRFDDNKADNWEKNEWLLTFVDFGMVGRLSSNFRTGMREMVIGVGTRDTHRLVKSYQMLDVLLPNADLSLIEKAEAAAFDRFWGKNMRELLDTTPQEMVDFTHEFRQLLYTLPFQVPQNLILLGRCVGILSGMCTGLNPNFNVWEGLAPFAQKLIAEETGTIGKTLFKQIEKVVQSLLSYPQRLERLMDKAEHGELFVHDPRLVTEVDHLNKSIGRLAEAAIFAVLLMGGIQLYLAKEYIFGGILLAIASLILIIIFLKGLRGLSKK